MGRKKMFFIGIAALAVSGCASFHSATYYPEGKYAATDPNRAQIYWNVPTRAYDVIGESHLSSGLITKAREKGLKEQIASMGGDGAICEVMSSCGDVFVPAQTNVQVVRPAGSRHRRAGEVTTVQHSPAHFETNCVYTTECKIIKFTT